MSLRSLNLPITEFFTVGVVVGWVGGSAKDSVCTGVLPALSEHRPKHFIEDLLKGTDGSSDRSVWKCAVKV